MPYFEILKFLLVFLLGALFLHYIKNFLKVSQARTNLIYFYHILFMFVRYYYGEYFPDDGPSYFFWATSDIYSNLTIKSHFYLIYIIRILNLYLGLNYIQVCLVFSILGSIGFLFLTSALQNVKTRNYSELDKLLILLFILLPSLNFYTSSIGKDCIILSAAGIFLYSLININNRFLLLLLSLMIIFLIRPYIGFFIIFSLLIFYIINIFSFSFIYNLISFSFIIFFILVLPSTFLKEYQVNIYNINFVIDFIKDRQLQYQQSDTFSDIGNMFFLLRPFNYVFRPFILETNSIFMLIAGLENLFLIFLFVYYIFKIKLKKIFHNKELQYIFIFSLILLCFLSSITSVIGIALRQKWIILFFIFYLFIASSNNSKKSKNYFQ